MPNNHWDNGEIIPLIRLLVGQWECAPALLEWLENGDFSESQISMLYGLLNEAITALKYESEKSARFDMSIKFKEAINNEVIEKRWDLEKLESFMSDIDG
ncbi:MAG: hypothetical protein ACD_3C00171G0003 [uncultured bacterium (gcode 4)]|uniref:Uncharacterized protein n=1 Tax=uncultured bacterium (gcode 4) TaxID=1234023 RepID=K2GBX8_9BACT|nr:MAG: hypothetical protein ACD_3C00171G0003 [uncultured bacterium (gcode 4)]